MMNSSRPVTDPKLAFFEELIARSLAKRLPGRPYLKEASLVLRRFKDFGNATGRAGERAKGLLAPPALEAAALGKDPS
jgi:hypothetical protein